MVGDARETIYDWRGVQDEKEAPRHQTASRLRHSLVDLVSELVGRVRQGYSGRPMKKSLGFAIRRFGGSAAVGLRPPQNVRDS